jgi:putative addiction module component (TIGR02574 family)
MGGEKNSAVTQKLVRLWHAPIGQLKPRRCPMSIPVEVLEVEVLNLPPAERSRLLDRLLASLDPNPEWEEAWAQEIDRREADIAAGRATWLAGEEVVARLRASLK